MKRPVLALLALLASLAVGLLAISPQRAEAMMLGELFCVDDIVSPRHEEAVGDFCPDCPFADEFATAPPRVCTPPGVPAADDAEVTTPTESPSVDATPAADVTAQVELNAPATSNVPDNNHAWEDIYGEYYGDFYSPEEVNDYGDDYANDYEDADDSSTDSDNFRYGENYDPWSPVFETAVSEPGPADLVLDDEEIATQQDVATTTSDAPYDLYGRQVGDEHYGYDFEEHTVEADEYEDAYEYEYEYDYELDVDEEPAVESDIVNDSSATPPADEADETSESYYEQYYPDYYAELYGEVEDDSDDAESHSDVESESVERADDEATQYDAAYEELIFGEANAAAQSDPAFVDELAEQSSSDAESDLPWADEVSAGESTSEAAESDYNADYADDYYRSLFGEDEETWKEAQESQEWKPEGSGYDNTYDYFHRPCHEECLHPRAFDATRLAVDLGRQVVAWTESLELVSMRLHSACVQLAELPLQRDTK